MRLPVNQFLPLAALVLLAACGGSGAGIDPTPLSPLGPAGDYPMVLGPAYTVGTATFTPADTLNYDAVGIAATGGEGGTAISLSHHTLPLPSYVEVTALNSGRTILARVERRGPMSGPELVQLSPGAAAQLGLGGEQSAEVRVRRVNPSEPERALLRGGQPAPVRMDTPKSLLEVLRRRLGQQGGELTRAAAPVPPVAAAAPALETVAAPQVPYKAPPMPVAAKPSKPSQPPKGAAPGASYVIQIGAFSTRERAGLAAHKAGARVNHNGKVWQVRMGPFATRAEADAALAKARAAGYSDARIQRAN